MKQQRHRLWVSTMPNFFDDIINFAYALGLTANTAHYGLSILAFMPMMAGEMKAVARGSKKRQSSLVQQWSPWPTADSNTNQRLSHCPQTSWHSSTSSANMTHSAMTGWLSSNDKQLEQRRQGLSRGIHGQPGTPHDGCNGTPKGGATDGMGNGVGSEKVFHHQQAQQPLELCFHRFSASKWQVFAFDDYDFLHMFNTHFPCPQANSWHLFWFSNKLSMLMFSKLLMQTLMRGHGGKSLWRIRYWHHWIALLHLTIPWHGPHAHQCAQFTMNDASPFLGLLLDGSGKVTAPEIIETSNSSSCATSHPSHIRIGWTTQPNCDLPMPVLPWHRSD